MLSPPFLVSYSALSRIPGNPSPIEWKTLPCTHPFTYIMHQGDDIYGMPNSGGRGDSSTNLGDKTLDDAHLHMSNKGDVHHVPDEPEGKWVHWPTLAAYVGPGFLVCIAYLDPGNLEADLQVSLSLKPSPFIREL